MRLKKTIFVYIIMILYLPVFAQGYGNGRRNVSGGLISVANPGQAGRVATVGGRLSPKLKVNHTVSVPGYIDTIMVNVGDNIVVGQPLVKITRNVAGETFLPVIINARIKGVVSEISVFEKQEVNTGASAVTILDNSSFLLVTTLSDRDTQSIRNLGRIAVTGITTEEKPFSGKILYISQEPDYDTGLFTLNIQFPKADGLFLGMVLFVDIEVQKAKGITVESTSVFRDGGKTYLWKVSKNNKLNLSEIVIENEIESKITIRSGLTVGESYINKITGNEYEGIEPKDLIKANLNNNSVRKKTDA